MDISLIFLSFNLAKGLAGYLGLIETIDAKLDKLAGSELEAGLRALKQAADSDEEATALLREARSRFNKAISLETNERLAVAYVGLAFCHNHLGDKRNCSETLRAIERLEIRDQAKTVALSLAEDTLMGGGPVIGPIIGPIVRSFTGGKTIAQTHLGVRKQRLQELKSSVRSYLGEENS